MYIEDFNYHRPLSIKEACKLLEQCNNGAVIAGGTDMLVEIKQGLRHHEDIISLTEIEDLKTINVNNDTLEIGAGVTHNTIALSPVVRRDFVAIAEAASKIGTEQIRNTGTVGGNLCTGASCCDMAPILVALNASVEIASSTNVKTVSLKDFFLFHKETSIEKGEIMTKVIVPLISKNVGACFEKFGLRESASISVASAAVVLKFDEELCSNPCVVIGAVAPTPITCERTNELLIRKKTSELSRNTDVLKKAGELASEDSVPIDDIRGSAEFRQGIVKVLVKRAIIKAAERASSND
jgi:carbon-monoxide dehydrogenase medium subunit